MALATPTAGGPGASTDLTGSSAAPSACPSSCDDFVFPLASLSEAQQWEEEQMHDESTNLISPFCPASEAQIHAALAFGNVTPSDVVLDLGCGDGRVCRTAVRLFSVSRALGVDINPFLVKEAEALTREEFPSCCSSLESSRFHFFELGIPADEDDEDSEQGEGGGGIPGKSGTAVLTSRRLLLTISRFVNDVVNLSAFAGVASKLVCVERKCEWMQRASFIVRVRFEEKLCMPTSSFLPARQQTSVWFARDQPSGSQLFVRETGKTVALHRRKKNCANK
ncbi:methyltransferase domain protein [Toxoplasma gondii MAS]|uniref:Methyltransferase domain protein n=1 Tax=Toxoplasma gondii MAS TaxID=943118 RepID=A0A086Q247_TOXGO|nr:methyltransferase domain protein [Toxoplasma gondii MAS]